jgi:hypothetical protein
MKLKVNHALSAAKQATFRQFVCDALVPVKFAPIDIGGGDASGEHVRLSAGSVHDRSVSRLLHIHLVESTFLYFL